MSFSIVILTFNEAANLPGCLDSVAWCDDVVVLDSGSDDATVEIARMRGARVVEHPFEDFAAQRNFANESIEFEHEWVFHLDADEHFTPELQRACEAAVEADEHSGYYVPNRMILFGRWIRRSSLYPYPQVRLVKLGEFGFARAGHGQRESWAERGLGSIDEPYDHFNFSKGIADWVERHNRYSTAEAESLMDAGECGGGETDEDEGGAEVSDRIRRLRRVKRRLGGSPLRALAKFGYLYLWRRGFLDGFPGLIYCGLQAFYEFLITAKVAEMRKLGNGES